MKEPTLARVVPVNPRSVWVSESADFTPWLAQHPDYLTEAIGLDLEELHPEQAVGAFSVDIVATVVGTDHRVVVENQLERTDHDHLGKLMTYAAGMEAHYAVWIATEFREEHRSALEWANSTTREGVGFFGLEIEVFRVGDSAPAVRLNPVVRPDNWAKEVLATQAAAPSAKGLLYREFWSGVLDRLQEHAPGWTSSKGSTDSWITLPAGRSHVYFALAFTRDHGLKAELTVDLPIDEARQALYEGLLVHRAGIEQALGGRQLTWEVLEDRRARRIFLSTGGSESVDEQDKWTSYEDWFVSNAIALRFAIQPVLDGLP